MQDGWIKVYRKMRYDILWEIKPFSKGQAWVDLLLRTNHTEKKILIDNTMIKILPGQIFTSEKKLAKQWGWSRHKIRNFFQVLFENGKIGTPERTPRFTLITIVKWGLYQSTESQKDSQKDIGGTSEGHRKDTNKKEDKNVKKEKNKDISFSQSKKEKELLFNEIWKKYPDKDGKKDALRHFNASVNTEDDWKKINIALANYLQSDRVKNGFIKKGSTFFNGWADWVDFKGVKKFIAPEPEPETPEQKAIREKREEEIEEQKDKKRIATWKAMNLEELGVERERYILRLKNHKPIEHIPEELLRIIAEKEKLEGK